MNKETIQEENHNQIRLLLRLKENLFEQSFFNSLTIITIGALNIDRKKIMIQFLKETELINKEKPEIRLVKANCEKSEMHESIQKSELLNER